MPVRPFADVGAQLGLAGDELVPHGHHRGKVALDAIAARLQRGPSASRYVLVTAVTPTPAGEGKTVTSIGLAMGLCRAGRSAVVTLRQSSLGPTLGRKGGGAGGGAARVEPFEDSLLGLGADAFAVETANNLLAARLDDAIARGMPADLCAVGTRRVLDMNDRALRHISVAIGELTRDTGFDITAASEVMAVLALGRDLADLRDRVGRMVGAFDPDGKPITAEDLGCAGAMAAMLRDALAPNLFQTSEGTPAIVHAGPFGNLAHGCSSVVGDLLGLATADIVVTEAGFASDLGAQKMLHLKCPVVGRFPDAVVLVATAQAATWHPATDGGGLPGLANLRRHLEIVAGFGLPVVVAVNRRPDDPPEVLRAIHAVADAAGAPSADHWAFTQGGAGCSGLATAVEDATSRPSSPQLVYAPGDDIADKVEAIATRVYGAGAVEWSEEALASLERLRSAGYGSLPVCIAKTHLSTSHDPRLVGDPRGFTFPVRDVRLYAGAGFATVYASAVLTMPGLPEHPRFLDIDLAPDGTVSGLI